MGRAFFYLFPIDQQKATWIGPVKFKSCHSSAIGASKLACILDALSQDDCDVTIVGSVASKTITDESNSIPAFSVIENASVWWDFLKGRKLPGVTALDRVSFLTFLLLILSFMGSLKSLFKIYIVNANLKSQNTAHLLLDPSIPCDACKPLGRS